MQSSAFSKSVVQYKLASAWQLKGRTQQAIGCLLKAIDLDPFFVPAYLECGALMELRGQREKAINLIETGVGLNPLDLGLKSALERLSRRARLQTNVFVDAPVKFAANLGKRILLYTDCSGVHGVEQNIVVLIEKLILKKYDVYCALPRANNYLIHKQSQFGARHIWLEKDNIYDLKKTPRAFTDYNEPEHAIRKIKPDFIFYANGCPYSNLTAQETAAKQNIPYISNIHCLNLEWFAHYSRYTKRLCRVLNNAKKVVAVSRKNIEQLRHHLNWHTDNGMVIYNGRPQVYFKKQDKTTRRKIRTRLEIPDNAVVCFTAARMEYVKGYHYQIEAIKSLKQHNFLKRLYFMWAGSGSLEARLRVLSAEAGIADHIRFLGEVDSVPDFLDASDIYVLTSRFEGMPLSIIEGMAKGLPVIATDVGGTFEALGGTGYLLTDPTKDPQATASALTAALQKLSENSEFRHKTGAACKRRASALFHASAMADAYLEQINLYINQKG